MTDRPNILFIVIDQLRADCLAGALADHVNLPNLQAFRAEAVTFLNHYSVCNPCGPSRASILTGQYAMNHGSVRNGTPLPHDTPTLGTEARRAGYRPMLFGYCDIAHDPRLHHPNDPDVHTYEAVAAGFDEVVEMRLEESFPWRAYLKSRGYDLPPYASFYAPQGSDPCDPAFYRAEDSDTAFLTDCVLRDLAVRPKGWFAHVTYIRPHPPFVAPEPYNRMYDPASLPVPEPESVKHPFLDAARRSKTAESCVQGLPDLAGSDEAVAKLRALYFGLATEVDHHIGRLLSFLKETGQFDDTMIVITADHGETLGDQGCWGKSSYLDAAFHTPLIIRDPGKPHGYGRDVTQPTESIDITPTILTRIGLSPPDTMDGRDLGVFLEGRVPEGWRQHSFSELDYGDPISATDVQASLGLRACEANFAVLRDASHSLVHFNGGLPAILFEHTAEGEARNLADLPGAAEKVLMLTQRMMDHRMSNPAGRFGQTMVTEGGVKRSPRHGAGVEKGASVAKGLRESARL
ncbi:MAG: sulfatase-like hydrolase/transferase [Boseongicola sp.]|nr:sulfatase-like hydrolase/transferase [Boseongicola sp.]NNJ67611.1 sulfatase-like hydrolase/transferase [Boseongicola sp.]